MKSLLSILLLVLMTFQLAIKTGTYLWFEWNQVEIATTACENKDKPELNCNGKCVLSKKLAAAEREEKQAPNPSTIKVKLEPTTLDREDLNLDSKVLDCEKTTNTNQPFINGSQFALDVFHPPQLA